MQYICSIISNERWISRSTSARTEDIYPQQKQRRNPFTTNFCMRLKRALLFACANDVERLVPGGILCAYSAWSHYGLTTQIPLSYCIAIERSRKVTLPEYPPIELFFLSKSVFELGVSETVIEGFQVKIYDMEKSVCDAVKYRNRIGIDVSSEILHNYLSRKDRHHTSLCLRQWYAIGQAYGRTRKIYDLTVWQKRSKTTEGQ